MIRNQTAWVQRAHRRSRRRPGVVVVSLAEEMPVSETAGAAREAAEGRQDTGARRSSRTGSSTRRPTARRFPSLARAGAALGAAAPRRRRRAPVRRARRRPVRAPRDAAIARSPGDVRAAARVGPARPRRDDAIAAALELRTPDEHARSGTRDRRRSSSSAAPAASGKTTTAAALALEAANDGPQGHRRHDRPGEAARVRARSRRRARLTRRARSTINRTGERLVARRDARHEDRVGRSRRPLLPHARPGAAHQVQPHLPGRVRAVHRLPGLHGDGASRRPPRAAANYDLDRRSTRRRRAARSTSSRRRSA